MAETNLATLPKTRLVRLAERGSAIAKSASARMKRAKEKAQRPVRIAFDTTACVGGGALDGVAEVYMPTLGNTDVPTSIVAGLGAVAIGATDWLEEGSGIAVEVGKGMLAGRASRMTEKLIRARM